MAKCDLCGQKIQTTFLNKLIGTFVKDKEGKQKVVCSDCQRKHKDIKSQF
jgi:DNA polymerase II large subunit